MEPDRQRRVQEPVQRFNWTTIALIGGLVFVVLLVAYFATRGSADQDKLTNIATTTTNATANAVEPAPDKMCAAKSTYDFIKRDLFRRAAQVRGSDQAAYDELAGYAVVRMDNPVMESEDSSTGAVNCSGSLSLDLPPGVVAVGGRRTLTADVDYTVQQAADGSGAAVLLRNADAIVTPLATLSRTAQPAQVPGLATTNEVGPNGLTSVPQARPDGQAPAEQGAAARPAEARPSLDCAKARSRGEIAVCSNPGLATLDRNLAEQFARSMATATPEQQALLTRTRDRFLRYRDRCPDNRCIGDAYVGRMREIRDIMEGSWQQPR